MKVACPACLAEVPARNIALDTGWAKCEACNEVFRLSEIAESQPATAPAMPERPFNARAVVDRSATELLIDVPAEGMRAGTWALFGFATLWTGFIAFWTLGALGVFFGNQGAGSINWAFASFSIPFWIIGFGMLGGVVWSARGMKTVRMDSQEMVTEKRCLFWSRTRRIDLTQVQHARPYQGQVQSQGLPFRGIEIVFEKGSFTLPADSDDEQEWLIAEINGFLESVSGRR